MVDARAVAQELVEDVQAAGRGVSDRLEIVTRLSPEERAALGEAVAALPGATADLVHRLLRDWGSLSPVERTAGLLAVAELLGAHLTPTVSQP